ncbi:CTNND2 [Acanthosepion pharaonis]|uniref:CTNND2 n=1 Tax=Acanthosepion pharaonis TaxID=158019 RepID=A0A812CGL0_ACAPH|nr:CTNND2 [Sepia pharaonis]
MVTGVLWNLSSCEELKKAIIDDCLTVLVMVVMIPHSGWGRQGTAQPQAPPGEQWTTVFRNASGVLRNISSAGYQARKRLRECDGLVESLIHAVKTAIGQSDIDNKPVENCVCILRNLSYRIQEVDDPEFYLKRTLQRQQRNLEKGENTGCFGGTARKKNAQKSELKARPDQSSNRMTPPKGQEILWHPDIVHIYLPLLADCSNPVTLEAAVGAIQNLAACDWQPGIDIRAAVRKEKVKLPFQCCFPHTHISRYVLHIEILIFITCLFLSQFCLTFVSLVSFFFFFLFSSLLSSLSLFLSSSLSLSFCLPLSLSFCLPLSLSFCLPLSLSLLSSLSLSFCLPLSLSLFVFLSLSLFLSSSLSLSFCLPLSLSLFVFLSLSLFCLSSLSLFLFSLSLFLSSLSLSFFSLFSLSLSFLSFSLSFLSSSLFFVFLSLSFVFSLSLFVFLSLSFSFSLFLSSLSFCLPLSLSFVFLSLSLCLPSLSLCLPLSLFVFLSLSLSLSEKKNLSLSLLSLAVVSLYYNRQSDNTTDDTICAVIATLYEIIKKNPSFAHSLLGEGGVSRLVSITQSEGLYLEKTVRYSAMVLHTMWQFKELSGEYRKQGYTESDFITKTSTFR